MSKQPYSVAVAPKRQPVVQPPPAAPASDQLRANFERISPEIARRILEYQSNSPIKQRTLSSRNVERYAGEMKRGVWHQNGEAVQFTAEGWMLNGQHRFHAIIASGTTQDLLVVRGVDALAFATYDQGNKRQASQFVTIDGDSKSIAAAVKLVMLYEQFNTMDDRGMSRFAMQEIIARINSEPDRWSDAANRTKATPLRGSIGIVLKYLAQPKYAVEMATFLRDVDTGLGLQETNAAYALRQRILGLRGNSKVRSPARQHVIAALAIKAWNFDLTGQPVKFLRWAETEPFPKMIV